MVRRYSKDQWTCRAYSRSEPFAGRIPCLSLEKLRDKNLMASLGSSSERKAKPTPGQACAGPVHDAIIDIGPPNRNGSSNALLLCQYYRINATISPQRQFSCVRRAAFKGESSPKKTKIGPSPPENTFKSRVALVFHRQHGTGFAGD